VVFHIALKHAIWKVKQNKGRLDLNGPHHLPLSTEFYCN